MNDKLNLVLTKYPFKNKYWGLIRKVLVKIPCICRSDYPRDIHTQMYLWTDPWNRKFPDMERVVLEYNVNADGKAISVKSWNFETTVEGHIITCRVANDLAKV
jgi:hypothetical protein